MRLSFQSVQAARESLDPILKVMSSELKWSREEVAKQKEDALTFLQVQMGEGVNRQVRESTAVSLKTKKKSFSFF